MLCIIDFETTDLVKKGVSDFLAQPGIVQIGATLVEAGDFSEVDAFQTLVNPEQSNWSEGAMKTHGIRPEDVAGAPTFFAAFPSFAKFVRHADTWVGYNTNFDKDVLWFQLLRYGFERNFPWPLNEIDVMPEAGVKVSIPGKRGNKYPKLVEVYDHLFHEEYDAHDALADVRATGRVLKELRK
jgi:DNA polymerase III epsilon subunit-like protein